MTDSTQCQVPNTAEKERLIALLTIDGGSGTREIVTTPDSFGEGARSRFERSGSCFFMRCP